MYFNMFFQYVKKKNRRWNGKRWSSVAYRFLYPARNDAENGAKDLYRPPGAWPARRMRQPQVAPDVAAAHSIHDRLRPGRTPVSAGNRSARRRAWENTRAQTFAPPAGVCAAAPHSKRGHGTMRRLPEESSREGNRFRLPWFHFGQPRTGRLFSGSIAEVAFAVKRCR